MAVKPESKPGEEAVAQPASPADGGGIKPWLPLLANLVLMPVLAYLTVTFFLNPKARNTPSEPAAAVSKSEGGTREKGGEAKEGAVPRGKATVPLSQKIIVNLAGSQGTRYILANIALVGTGSDFKGVVERNDFELRDAAMGVLSSKTIADLEKPGARNVVRSELVSVFSNILGEGVVKEIYLTEFAIQ